jgi:hypothetical protein
MPTWSVTHIIVTQWQHYRCWANVSLVADCTLMSLHVWIRKRYKNKVRHKGIQGNGGTAPLILNITRDGSDWSVSRPGRFTPEERALCIHWFESVSILFARSTKRQTLCRNMHNILKNWKAMFEEKLLIFQRNSSVVCQEILFRRCEACRGAKGLFFRDIHEIRYSRGQHRP